MSNIKFKKINIDERPKISKIFEIKSNIKYINNKIDTLPETNLYIKF